MKSAEKESQEGQCREDRHKTRPMEYFVRTVSFQLTFPRPTGFGIVLYIYIYIYTQEHIHTETHTVMAYFDVSPIIATR